MSAPRPLWPADDIGAGTQPEAAHAASEIDDDIDPDLGPPAWLGYLLVALGTVGLAASIVIVVTR